MQQGFVNFMYLGRALIHPTGSPPIRRSSSIRTTRRAARVPGSVIDTSAGEDTRLQYMGVSQGAIMGGALTALEPDADRGVLNVAGMNYSTLLRRSVDSDEYFKIPGRRPLRQLPERARAAAAALADPAALGSRRGQRLRPQHDRPIRSPNTPPHEVLLQAALGDHQVANVSAEVEARTIGAAVYSPALQPGRHWEATPFMGSDAGRTRFPYTGGSMLVYYDGGPVWFTGTRRRGHGDGAEPERAAAHRVGLRRRPARLPAGGRRRARPGGAASSAATASRVHRRGRLCFSNGYTGPTP